MPTYRYRATQQNGRIMRGTLTVSNEAEISSYLTQNNLELISVTPIAPKKPYSWLQKQNLDKQLADFCMQMTGLLGAGVSFVPALETIAHSMPPCALKDCQISMIRDIQHGAMITSCFRAHPYFFSPIFCSILSSGEHSGHLHKSFLHLSDYTQWRVRFQEQSFKALRYPLLLLFIVFGVVNFMMVFVVPKMVDFLESIGSELPLASRLLITLSHTFAQHWWGGMICFGVAIAVTIIFYCLSAPIALRLDRAMLSLPLVGEIIYKLNIARLIRCQSTLYQSCMDMPRSLDIAKDTILNRALREKILEAIKKIEAGQSLSHAMDSILPLWAISVIKVGEAGGNIEASFNHITQIYDADVENSTARIIGMVQPSLTIFVGLILAWVILGVLVPVYSSLANNGYTP